MNTRNSLGNRVEQMGNKTEVVTYLYTLMESYLNLEIKSMEKERSQVERLSMSYFYNRCTRIRHVKKRNIHLR